MGFSEDVVHNKALDIINDIRNWSESDVKPGMMQALVKDVDGVAETVANLLQGETVSLGEAVFPLLTVLLAGYIGWRGTWNVAGFTLILITMPIILALLHKQKIIDPKHAVKKIKDSIGDDIKAPQRQWTRNEVLRDKKFYMLMPGYISSGFVLTAMFFHQNHLAEVKGWSLTFFASTFIVFSFTRIVTMLVFGYIIDKASPSKVLRYYLWPLALSMVCLGVSDHYSVGILFMLLAGITCGISGSISTPLWAEFYGIENLGAIRSLVSSVAVFGTAAAPLIAGILLDIGMTFDQISILLALYVVISIGLVYMTQLHKEVQPV